jgi:hypothetical protein
MGVHPSLVAQAVMTCRAGSVTSLTVGGADVLGAGQDVESEVATTPAHWSCCSAMIPRSSSRRVRSAGGAHRQLAISSAEAAGGAAPAGCAGVSPQGRGHAGRHDASVKGALQRAWARLAELALGDRPVTEPIAQRARALLDQYIPAFENADAAVLERLLLKDATRRRHRCAPGFAGRNTCVLFLGNHLL